VIAIVTKRFLDKLLRKPYREAYVEENVRTGVAYQIRALREKRGWSQKKLAEVLGKPQSVLSRIEDPDYGKLSVQTLLEVAAALDVALLVQFASFPEFVERMEDVSPEGLNRPSFDVAQFQTVDESSQVATELRRLVLAPVSPNALNASVTCAAVNFAPMVSFLDFATLRAPTAEAANSRVEAYQVYRGVPFRAFRRTLDLQSAGAEAPAVLPSASTPASPSAFPALEAWKPNQGALPQ